LVRELSDKEVAWKYKGTQEYQDLAVRSLQTLREVEPLTEPQADRPRFDGSSHKTKGES